MTPKLVLWLAVASLSILWYALDPAARGPSVSSAGPAAPITTPTVRTGPQGQYARNR